MVKNNGELMDKNEFKCDSEVSKELSKKELKELLIKSHFTHDGMWFFHCQKECGMKVANKLNRAAIKSFAAVEIKRIQAAFGLDGVKNMQSLDRLLQCAEKIFKADFMKTSYAILDESRLRIDLSKCWTFEGIKQMGIIDEYECGVFDRFEGWFESLGLHYRVEPLVKGCMMPEQGKCYRNYKFSFT
ncbi:MAG: DUF6125 family protein [Promethearchaeota archaeon]